MKIKSIWCVLMLGLVLSCVSIFADSYQGDYCRFNGIISDPDITLEQQFAMLLEREGFPNFQEISKAVAAVAVAPRKDLNNPTCPIYSYSRALIEYYDKNKGKITADKPYIAEMLDIIKKKIS